MCTDSYRSSVNEKKNEPFQKNQNDELLDPVNVLVLSYAECNRKLLSTCISRWNVVQVEYYLIDHELTRH